jgi:hypothetical protein
VQVKDLTRDGPPLFTDGLDLGDQHGSLIGPGGRILTHKLLQSMHEGCFVNKLKEVHLVSLGGLPCLISAFFTVARATRGLERIKAARGQHSIGDTFWLIMLAARAD